MSTFLRGCNDVSVLALTRLVKVKVGNKFPVHGYSKSHTFGYLLCHKTKLHPDLLHLQYRYNCPYLTCAHLEVSLCGAVCVADDDDSELMS